MAEYLPGLEGLPTSFSEILASMFADYQARLPGWVPYGGAPEVIIMEVVALRHAVRLDVDAQVLAQIFTYYGGSIAGVPVKAAVPATVAATIHVGAGYVAEAHELTEGFRVALEGPEGPIYFATTAPVLIAAGEATAPVTLAAITPGVEGNGLSGTVTPLDTRSWLQSIVLTGVAGSGEDEEEETSYRDRLVTKERRDSPTIITAVDAQEALLELPGIGRCLILDNYVPAAGEEPAKENVPGAFTAVLAQADGTNVTAETKAAALALIEDERLLDLEGHAIDPTRTPVTVAYTFTVFPGWETAAVKAAADAAIAEYLSDALWGLQPGPGGLRDWHDELTVRFGELYGVLNTVQGLNHVGSVTINGKVNTDVALTGPGALPTVISITGTPE